jgi:hypothetical protein
VYQQENTRPPSADTNHQQADAAVRVVLAAAGPPER